MSIFMTTKSRLCFYLSIFLGAVILFSATFEALSFIYRPLILMPISYTGFLILKVIGIPITFLGPVDVPGFCEYRLPQSILQVTFGCTGIFALFILLSGIAAYPVPVQLKAIGMLIGIPAFYVYSILRLVIIGGIGYWYPGAIDFIHSFLMEIINVAFVLFVYMLWIRYVEKTTVTI
ncbi:MAG: hypothetical protein M1426_01940 [Patescibacteria group bacterium]|nr:hypothetical protein [Patescibacteria group bacterium]